MNSQAFGGTGPEVHITIVTVSFNGADVLTGPGQSTADVKWLDHKLRQFFAMGNVDILD